MLDLLIRGAEVLDGRGAAARRADVGVVDGHIADVAPRLDGEAQQVIDGTGLHLAPGFVDAHTHSDLTLLADPCAHSKVRQGVTTEVIGNCGSSSAPLAGAAVEEARTDAALLELEVTWGSLGAYLDRLRAAGTAVNVVPQVGHNTVRSAVMGLGDGQPTPDQLAAMERLVDQAMDEGARGLSTGLYYPPGFYAPTAEVVSLACVAARHGAFYSSHIRSESDGLLGAVDEALAIGRQAELPVEIAHLKVSGFRNWHTADALVERLEAARRQGVQVGCDQYPYAASSTWLAAWLPYWAQAGGGAAIACRLRDQYTRTRIQAEYRDRLEEWQNRSGVADWSDILIVGCPRYRDLQGQTVAAMAAARGREPVDAAIDLLAETECEVSCVWFSQSDAVVSRLIQLPFVAAGSDSSAVSPDGVLGRRQTHPRAYGTFPRILRQCVREEGTLALAEAVRKMTCLPAVHLGLTGRGVVEPGAWADLVLFDADSVTDRATYEHPHQYPAGIPWVIVNGQVVVGGGQHTGSLPGQVL